MQREDHRPRAKEQQRFEKCVRRQMEHRRSRTAQTDCHDHVTELRQRRISQNALDVVLLNGDQRRKQRGESAHIGNHFQRRRVQQKNDPAQHVTPRRNHRCRVNQRAHRRRAFHRVRQPDVKRKLGRLADRSAEDEQARNRCQRSERRRIGRQLLLQRAEVQRSQRAPHHQDAQDKTEIPKPVRQKRLLGGIRRGWFGVPEANQQVTRDADQLPAHEQLDEIVGQHDAEHREHEQAQAGEKS